MPNRRLFLLAIGLLLTWGRAGLPVFSRWMPPCFDSAGVRVALRAQYGTGTAVAQRNIFGNPEIVYDPIFFETLSPVTQDFIYLHECGHHVMGHLYRMLYGEPYLTWMEDQADAYAGSKMALMRYTHRDIAIVQYEIGFWYPDAQHRWGTIRAFIVGTASCATDILRSYGML